MYKKIITALLASAFTLPAGSKEASPALEKLRPPQIISPGEFVSQQLKRYKAREQVLNALLQRADDLPAADSFEQAIQQSTGDMPKAQTLTVHMFADDFPAVADESPLDPDLHPIKPHKVFIDRMSIAATTSPFAGSSDYATEPVTSAVLNISDIAGLKLQGDVIAVYDNPGLMKKGCCLRKNKEDECVKQAEVPTLKTYRNVDLRRLVNDKIQIQPGSGMQVAGDKEAGFKFTRPGRHELAITALTGMKESVFSECLNGKKQALDWVVERKEDKNLTFDAVEVQQFGIKGLDFLVTENGNVTPGRDVQQDYFLVEDTTTGFKGKITAGEAALKSGATTLSLSPMITVRSDEKEAPRAQSFPIDAQESNNGPFSLSRRGSQISLPTGFRPGASVIKWSLAEEALTAEHRFTANKVHVELDERIGFERVLAETEYEARVVVEGAADLSQYQVEWQGQGINWKKADSPFNADGKIRHIATNHFTVTPGTRPAIELRFAGAEGEIFSYRAQPLQFLNSVAKSPVAAVELHGSQGHLGEPEALADNQLDFFYPNMLGGKALQANFRAIVSRNDGSLFEFSKLDENLGTVDKSQAAQLMRDSMRQLFPTDDPSGIFASGLALASNGDMSAFIAQHPGQAKIMARIGGDDIDPDNLLGTPDGSILKSPLINVTSNSVQLLRNKDGFILRVRGPADMSQYQASWKRRGFSRAKTTGFVSTEQGAEAVLKTTEQLSSVEIIQQSDVHVSIPGITAQLDAKIKLVVDSARAAVQKVPLASNNDLESLNECRETIRFGIQAMEFDTGGKSVDQFCRDERALNKAKIKDLRKQQKAANKALKNLEKQNKQLIALAKSISVGAFIEGLPDPVMGRVQCRWKIKNAGSGLKVKAALTEVKRASQNQGSCFNIVEGVQEGFDPRASLEVALILDDRPATKSLIKNDFEKFFTQEKK